MADWEKVFETKHEFTAEEIISASAWHSWPLGSFHPKLLDCSKDHFPYGPEPDYRTIPEELLEASEFFMECAIKQNWEDAERLKNIIRDWTVE